MEPQSDSTDEIANIKEIRQQIQSRIETLRNSQLEIISSLQYGVVPDITSSLDLHLKVVSSFNGRPFTPLPSPLPAPNPNTRRRIQPPPPAPPIKISKLSDELQPKPSTEGFAGDEGGSGTTPLATVRSMVAVCLLERVPFTEIDSASILSKLESDSFQSVTVAEKAALREVAGGETILAVELALRSMAEDNGGVQLEEFKVNGKFRVLVKGIDRTKLVKELPESKQNESNSNNSSGGNAIQQSSRTIGDGGWMGQGDPSQFGGGQIMGPRGMMGMLGRPRGMGVNPMHRPPPSMGGMYSPMHSSGGGSNGKPPRTEEDDLKDLEALLNKKSFKELQKSKTGEELLDLIHRPTAKETAVAAKFKSKGGSQVKEYCTALTKEDCRRQSGSFISCEKVHFRRIIAVHTDMNLGDCSFLDTCRHMKTCKYVHYELDSTPDVAHMNMMMGVSGPSKPLKPQRAEYCSEVELGESQWINCDIRNFRMDILGQYGVIMADPPWDIHMELPYGTMADDEMRNLNIQALQTDGLIFLWVTGRAMELGRECLDLWGYKRVEEIIWVKTNQLQRIIRTGRTGHWLNHSKEHCLVGIKGDPIVNRNIDTDVIVAEVRETSRKPDEMYPLLERISPRTRKLELFARMHNTHAGWMSLGNQLSGARLVDDGLRARFKAAYPEVEVQPASPPRASAMEVDTTSPSPFSESKPMSAHFSSDPNYGAESNKPMDES
ncbi:unnamed protein product [Lactuca saligna]|uniref:N6-adenosine-methyltransferase MT-A70-like n=1 Tax=Lactuca saligna TaxID=75948 RepID=A0AA35YIM6_LACSI|nr:unnamed protein product [Lactuca saligna]